jgi:hypothetical protein
VAAKLPMQVLKEAISILCSLPSQNQRFKGLELMARLSLGNIAVAEQVEKTLFATINEANIRNWSGNDFLVVIRSLFDIYMIYPTILNRSNCWKLIELVQTCRDMEQEVRRTILEGFCKLFCTTLVDENLLCSLILELLNFKECNTQAILKAFING